MMVLKDSLGRVKEQWVNGEMELHISYSPETPPYRWESTNKPVFRVSPDDQEAPSVKGRIAKQRQEGS